MAPLARAPSRPPASRFNSFAVSLKHRSLWRDAFDGAPLFQEDRAPAGVAFVGDFERIDPIGAKMAEPFAQFAPSRDHAHAIEKGERERPDRAPGRLRGAVAIGDPELALGADRLANGGDLALPGGDPLAGADDQRRRLGFAAQARR